MQDESRLTLFLIRREEIRWGDSNSDQAYGTNQTRKRISFYKAIDLENLRRSDKGMKKQKIYIN